MTECYICRSDASTVGRIDKSRSINNVFYICRICMNSLNIKRGAVIDENRIDMIENMRKKDLLL